VPHIHPAPQSPCPTIVVPHNRWGRLIAACVSDVTYRGNVSTPSSHFTPGLHSRVSLPPVTLPLFTLHCTSLYTSPTLHYHPSLRRPSFFIPPLFTLHSFTLHSLCRPLPFIRPLFTPHSPTLPSALHCAAIYPSFCRSLPFNPPSFTPPPPPYTPPPLTPPLACHDLCDFRIVRLNLG
jgi:hypothetical protein